MSGKSMDDEAGAWYVINETTLANFQVENAEKVVEKLWDMYFDEMFRSLIRFESVLMNVMEFYRNVDEMKEHS